MGSNRQLQRSFSFSMIGLGKKSVKSVFVAIIGLAAVIFVLAGYGEIGVLFVAGLAGILNFALHQKIMSSFVDAMNIASVAIISAVILEISHDMLVDWRSIVISIAGLLFSFFQKYEYSFYYFGRIAIGLPAHVFVMRQD